MDIFSPISSGSGIASGTTQTFNLPNASGTIVTTGNLANITTVGTVGSGTWQGSPVGVQYGGTGAVSFYNRWVSYMVTARAMVQASAAGTGVSCSSPVAGSPNLRDAECRCHPVTTGGTDSGKYGHQYGHLRRWYPRGPGYR